MCILGFVTGAILIVILLGAWQASKVFTGALVRLVIVALLIGIGGWLCFNWRFINACPWGISGAVIVAISVILWLTIKSKLRPRSNWFESLHRWKYRTKYDSKCKTRIAGLSIKQSYVVIDAKGNLTVKQGYAWDGPSGPTFDTVTFMRGSLFHDALYQLMRSGALSLNHRKTADQLLKEHCVADGMWKVRAWWVYYAVRCCAESSARPRITEQVEQGEDGRDVAKESEPEEGGLG